ncbi:hypothetical protein B0H10DRAFT_1960877 [Mycena sp. CBHHK59/15]|nr:hypothetical protein B0H10DRAFT_1960877 [Mycena sp. CBHHK59/15]
MKKSDDDYEEPDIAREEIACFKHFWHAGLDRDRGLRRASNSNMAKAKKQPAKKKKKGRPSYVNPIIWRYNLRVGAPRDPVTRVQLWFEGRRSLMISDDEDDDDIKIVDGPPATPSSLASHQPQQPLHQPLISSVFTPLSALGSRLPRTVALRQPARRTQMSYLFGAKVEPGCGNVHTLVLLSVEWGRAWDGLNFPVDI